MKGSLIIVSCFVLGVMLSYWGFIPQYLLVHDMSRTVLMVLIVLVGLSLGLNNELQKVLRNFNFKILLVPLCCIVGTFAGVALVSLGLKDLSTKDALAVGSGFGYYSLSSLMILDLKGVQLSVIALLCNISRELITLLFAPLMVKYFGKLAPIASGGATSMDTTLPIISQYSDADYIVIALFNGAVLELCVPLLVTLFAR